MIEACSPAKPRVLITIPISHFSARRRAGPWSAPICPMRSAAHLPGLHRIAVRRAGGKGTAPVLVCPDRVLWESADIIEYTDAQAPAERRRSPRTGFGGRAGPGRAPRPGLRKPHSRRRRVDYCRARQRFSTTWHMTWDPVRAAALIQPHLRADHRGGQPGTRHHSGDRSAVGPGHTPRCSTRSASASATAAITSLGDRFTTADLTFAALAAPAAGAFGVRRAAAHGGGAPRRGWPPRSASSGSTPPGPTHSRCSATSAPTPRRPRRPSSRGPGRNSPSTARASIPTPPVTGGRDIACCSTQEPAIRIGDGESGSPPARGRARRCRSSSRSSASISVAFLEPMSQGATEITALPGRPPPRFGWESSPL